MVVKLRKGQKILKKFLEIIENFNKMPLSKPWLTQIAYKKTFTQLIRIYFLDVNRVVVCFNLVNFEPSLLEFLSFFIIRGLNIGSRETSFEFHGRNSGSCLMGTEDGKRIQNQQNFGFDCHTF